MQYLPVSGEVQDIVDVVQFIASSNSKFITGEALNVHRDGGVNLEERCQLI
jgi:NAD(P)-dependent dehydrogenase (short-subunit alcohol dehydrogenase family)